MVIYGHQIILQWLHMVIYGYIYIYMVIYGYILLSNNIKHYKLKYIRWYQTNVKDIKKM